MKDNIAFVKALIVGNHTLLACEPSIGNAISGYRFPFAT
jgi:hypothetical protein